MKELTFETLLAVFQEMFGPWLFWVLVAGAAAVTVVYLFVLFRDRRISMRKFLLAQLAMPVGAIAAVVFLQTITNSHFRDLGGPVDWLVLVGVASLGAVGIAILVYTAQSLIRPPGQRSS